MPLPSAPPSPEPDAEVDAGTRDRVGEDSGLSPSPRDSVEVEVQLVVTRWERSSELRRQPLGE